MKKHLSLAIVFILVIISFLINTSSVSAVGYTVLHNFDNTKEYNPTGLLIASSGILYGATQYGEIGQGGAIYSYDLDSGVYTRLYEIDHPHHIDIKGLVLYDGVLYGVTGTGGGAEEYGTLFSFNLESNIFNELHAFDYNSGCFPRGSLVESGGKLYGLTVECGLFNKGTFFSYDIANSTFSNLYNFDGTIGARPSGSLIENQTSPGNFLGLASVGGQDNLGTLFSISEDSNGIIGTFYADGGIYNPIGPLTQKDGKFYGVAMMGGVYDSGGIFLFDSTIMSWFIDELYEINPAIDGLGIQGVTERFGKLYGLMNEGGIEQSGSIFLYDLTSREFTTIFDSGFGSDEGDAMYPSGPLLSYENKLYGIASEGGLGYGGVLFEYDPNVAPLASVPTISGEPSVGEILTGDYTYLDEDGDLEGISTYRWLRDNVAIEGATSIAYTLQEADVGATIKFEITPVAATGVTIGTPVESDETETIVSAVVPNLVLVTNPATSIERQEGNPDISHVTLNGEITTTGGENATSRGFEYGTVASGTYELNYTEEGSYSVGAFSIEITTLNCGTDYHYRAFGVNSVGTSYGDEVLFTSYECIPSGRVHSSYIGYGYRPGEKGPEQDGADNLLNLLKNPIEDQIISPETNTDIILKKLENKRKNTSHKAVVVNSDSVENNNQSIEENENVKSEDFSSDDSQNRPNIKKDFSLSAIKTIEKISENLKTDEGKIIAETVAITGIIAGVSANVASGIGVIPLSTGTPFIFKNVIDLFGFFMFASTKRNRDKKRFWGTVYDSITKQPLDPAYVVLLNLQGKEIATSITDLDGRYSFMVPPGSYRIKVKKTNYKFPSSKLNGQTEDILYSDLYFNEIIELKEDGVITKNIPMDPTNFDWNEFAKREQGIMNFFSRKEMWLGHFSRFLFILGLLITIAVIIFIPSIFNFVILGIYLILLIFRLTIFKPKLLGMVKTSTTQNPLSFAIIRIFQVETNQEIAHKITDKAGKYYGLVPNGKYYVKIEKKNLDESYSLVYTSSPFEIKKGYINKSFEINI